MDFIDVDRIDDFVYSFYKYCDCTICGLCFPELYKYCENINSKNIMDKSFRCDRKVKSYIEEKLNEFYKES